MVVIKGRVRFQHSEVCPHGQRPTEREKRGREQQKKKEQGQEKQRRGERESSVTEPPLRWCSSCCYWCWCCSCCCCEGEEGAVLQRSRADARLSVGHAGACATGQKETADAKNSALKAVGVRVPQSFEDFGVILNELYVELVNKGTILVRAEPPVPSIPVDYEWANKLGLIRKPSAFVSSIVDERGETGRRRGGMRGIRIGRARARERERERGEHRQGVRIENEKAAQKKNPTKPDGSKERWRWGARGRTS